MRTTIELKLKSIVGVRMLYVLRLEFLLIFAILGAFIWNEFFLFISTKLVATLDLVKIETF